MLQKQKCMIHIWKCKKKIKNKYENKVLKNFQQKYKMLLNNG